MPEIEKQTAVEFINSIQTNQTEIIKDLEELKVADEPHAGFYEGLQKRQAKIVCDLGTMMSENKRAS